MTRIAIVDEIDVRGADVAAIRARYLSDYAPTARARGMALELALQSPPVPVAAGENRLTFVWSVPDLPGWWRMRLAGAADPAVTGFWAALAPAILGRRRSCHAMDADV